MHMTALFEDVAQDYFTLSTIRQKFPHILIGQQQTEW